MKRVVIGMVLALTVAVSCNKEPKVTEQTAEQVDNLWTLSAEEEKELDLIDKAREAQDGEQFFEDSLTVAKKESGDKWVLELKDSIQKDYIKKNGGNINERSLPKVPADVTDATTLSGRGYRFSSDVEGDS